MEPVTHQFGLAKRAGSACEDEKRHLEGILGGVPVAEDLLTDA